MLSKEERHRLAARIRLGETYYMRPFGPTTVTFKALNGGRACLWVLGVKVCEYTYEAQGRAVDGIYYPTIQKFGVTLQEFALAYLEREE